LMARVALLFTVKVTVFGEPEAHAPVTVLGPMSVRAPELAEGPVMPGIARVIFLP